MKTEMHTARWAKMKFVLFVAFAAVLAACNSNNPTKSYVGTWVPILDDTTYPAPDVFLITSDSIKAIQQQTKQEHHQCHYKVLRDSIVELERCWLENNQPDGGYGDWYPGNMFVEEVYMYIDKDGFLIIRPFDILVGELAEIYPNYTNLKLRKLQ